MTQTADPGLTSDQWMWTQNKNKKLIMHAHETRGAWAPLDESAV